jgi:hypothetical protein
MPTPLSPRTRLATLTAVTAALLALPPAARAEEPRKAELPLSRVTLFSAGVGYFEHRGDVDGDVRVEMRFDADDVNDLLKSLVVQDLGGGRVSSAAYGSKDPVTKALQSFAIDLTQNLTIADLLRQVRGEPVILEVPARVEGKILSVEVKRRPVGEKGEIVETEWLNLLTADGVRSIPLESVQSLRIADPSLQAELEQALVILAQAHSTEKKTVAVEFRGEGSRPVRVAYVQETPIWKTSYRLVLRRDGAPFLQGWAIVENTTERDWKDVALTLVSGRPVSFTMDLYEPLYVPRPEVELELYASLRPKRYEENLRMLEEEKRASKSARRGAPADAAPPAPSAPPPALANGGAAAEGGEAYDDAFDLQRGVQSAAQGGDVGELFQYRVENPVSLERQRSAMIPIVNADVEAEKISIYDPAMHPKHPMDGLRLRNTSGLHLMQGPITVFDGGTYAGEALILDMPPDGERLISYALDIDVEVAPEAKSAPQDLVDVRIQKGSIHASYRQMKEVVYAVKNGDDADKIVLVEHPFDANWTLLQPKEPAEKTRNAYRFEVKVAAGATASLTVREQRTYDQRLILTNLNSDAIINFSRSGAVTPEMREALQRVVAMRTEIERLSLQRRQHEQTINEISQEQNRIRENMGQIDRTSTLYQRYIQKLGQQEDQIEQTRRQIETIQKEENDKRRALDEYLMGLSFE